MSIQVTARKDWFEKAERHSIEPGATLLEIVKQCNVPHWLEEAGEVSINGHPIPRENWHSVRPKTGTRDRPVTITIYPPALHGGGGGQTKQVITIVATLAIIAGTAFIGAGGLALLGASQTLFGAAGTLTPWAASPFGVPGKLKLPVRPC